MTTQPPLKRYGFGVQIELESPFLQTGLASEAWGYDDAPLAAKDGLPLVSGDQIEGFLRHVMERAGLAEGDRKAWFGNEGDQIDNPASTAGSFDKPERARLKIFDLAGPRAEKVTMHRIRIDDDTGAAAQGAWQVIALAAMPGAEVKFEGYGRLFGEDRQEALDFVGLANAVFKMIPAIGAIKASGFGRVLSAHFGEPDAGQELAPAKAKGAAVDAIAVRLMPKHPLLVDVSLRSGNVIEGSEIVPGATIKGAIADMLRNGGALDDYAELLSAVTIRHAIPSKGARPRHAPLSLIFDGAKGKDILGEEASGVPLLQPDWKTKHRRPVAARFYLDGELKRHVRTRTAVGANNAPIEEKLFSTRAVDADGIAWHSAIILPEDAESELKERLGALAEWLEEWGIASLGKSAAEVRVETHRGGEIARPVTLEPDETARITLQSPAWILRFDDLFENGKRRVRPLKAAYQDYFGRVAPGAVLIDFIAAQDWSGGVRAVGVRSQLGPDCYYPWLLTRAGSVFRVKGIDEKRLGEWARLGLPEADADRPLAERRNWMDCPFVRKNGFGEVAIDLKDVTAIGDTHVS